MAESQAGAILVVDVGTARTKAALFDIVEGSRRYVAGGCVPTTLHGSMEDVSIGVRSAITQIEDTTGRRLIGPGGPITPQRGDGTGVDLFTSTSSTGDQLRLLLLAIDPESRLSLEAKKAARTHNANLEVFASPDGPGRGRGTTSETLQTAIARFDPQALILVGGGGEPSASLTEIIEMVAKELKYLDNPRPKIFFAGGGAESVIATRALQDRFDLKVVSTDGNRSGQGISDSIGQHLITLWQERIVEDVPGYSLVVSWQNSHVLPTRLALGASLSFLSRFHQRDVLGVDVGASTTSIFRIQADKQEVQIVPNLGVSAESLAISSEDIRAWLPFEISQDRITSAIWNKYARPWTLPAEVGDSLLETAFAVSALKRACETLPRRAQLGAGKHRALLILSGGPFRRTGRSAELLLALLDGVEPVGAFDIAIDKLSILPQLGALAVLDPRAAAEGLCNDALIKMASCVACSGVTRSGSSAIRVEIKGNAKDTSVKAETSFGELRLIAPTNAPSTEVGVKIANGLDAGWGSGKGGKAIFDTGQLGLIIDARGRPPQLPTEDAQKRAVRRKWLSAVGVMEEDHA